MQRRRFLALSAASGLALGSGRLAFGASSGPAAAAVVVTDISVSYTHLTLPTIQL
mgnify:CR=1 FL=1